MAQTSENWSQESKFSCTCCVMPTKTRCLTKEGPFSADIAVPCHGWGRDENNNDNSDVGMNPLAASVSQRGRKNIDEMFHYFFKTFGRFLKTVGQYLTVFGRNQTVLHGCDHNPLLQAKTPTKMITSVKAGMQLQNPKMYQNVEHSHASKMKNARATEALACAAIATEDQGMYQ